MALDPADATEVIRLWPDGPPFQIEGVGEEVAYRVPAGIAKGTTFLRNISDATLTVFDPSDGKATNGVGVIVAPGGGWTINAWTHEGIDVARWLTQHGYTAFLLKYRVQGSGDDQERFEARMAKNDAALAGAKIPTKKLPRAISELVSTEAYRQARGAAADDGRRAITLVREHAQRFGVRPDDIGMIGFSAGAFLAVDVALDPRGAPLAFLAPIYGGETNGAQVPDDAPPLFTAVAQDDALWRIVQACMRTGRTPTARRRRTSSLAARTASGWSARACHPTGGPTSSSRGSKTSLGSEARHPRRSYCWASAARSSPGRLRYAGPIPSITTRRSTSCEIVNGAT